jgi:hypothetical protein
MPRNESIQPRVAQDAVMARRCIARATCAACKFADLCAASEMPCRQGLVRFIKTFARFAGTAAGHLILK